MEQGEFPNAITKDSVLRKLRFLRFGKDSEQHISQFADELIKFHKEAKASLTKQAVRNWFARNSAPTGLEANLYLKRYFEAMKLSDISAEQTKVRFQLERYFRHFTLRPDQRKIRISREGHLQFQMAARVKEILKATESITGVYLTYKRRFSENEEKPVAQEVLRVFVEDHDLRFEHWYIRQGNRISRFEGSVFPLDKLLWFFGVTEMEPDRLRIMSLARTDELNDVFDNYRWGILHSEVPFGSHDPAACRILLTAAPYAAEGEINQFVRDNVKHLSFHELPSANKAIIERLIDNQLTSLSIHHSIEPAVGRSGPVVDSILKVDQQTMRTAVDQWVGKVEPPDQETSGPD